MTDSPAMLVNWTQGTKGLPRPHRMLLVHGHAGADSKGHAIAAWNALTGSFGPLCELELLQAEDSAS